MKLVAMLTIYMNFQKHAFDLPVFRLAPIYPLQDFPNPYTYILLNSKRYYPRFQVMKYLGPSPPWGVCQLISCAGTLMSHVLQWMQLQLAISHQQYLIPSVLIQSLPLGRGKLTSAR